MTELIIYVLALSIFAVLICSLWILLNELFKHPIDYGNDEDGDYDYIRRSNDLYK